MKRILFVHNGNESFVEVDLAILKQGWSVIDRFEQSRYRLNPASSLSSVLQADLIFCWFASWHSILPVLAAQILHKPSIIVTGGYDTANVPEAGYGSQRGGTSSFVANTVIRSATCLVVNSQSAFREVVQNTPAKPDKIRIIYHGFKPFAVKPSPVARRVALTVGGVRQENLLRKGLLPFVQSAELLPHIQFVLVGQWLDDSINELRKVASNNVLFTGRVSLEELYGWYSKATVYVQPSLHEGFGMSVAEAMSVGCVPIVSRAGSLPEVVGDVGIYLNSTSPGEIANAVQEGFRKDASWGDRARKHVLNNFPLERRREKLIALVEEYIGQSAF